MNRYFNSFFITSILYSSFGFAFLYAINDIKIEPKQEDVTVKISLNSVSMQQEAAQEPASIQNEPKPILPKPKPIVEKPKPIVEKTVEKKSPPKKMEPKVQEPKPIEKVIKKESIKEAEPMENIEEKVVKNVTPSMPISKTSLNKIPNKPTSTKEISTIELASIESAYLSKIKAKIEKNKVYPKAAKRLRQTGKVLVSFDVLKDGSIENIKIIEKSKFERLDAASIELLLKIASFEAIPKELNKAAWSIRVPINYSIN